MHGSHQTLRIGCVTIVFLLAGVSSAQAQRCPFCMQAQFNLMMMQGGSPFNQPGLFPGPGMFNPNASAGFGPARLGGGPSIYGVSHPGRTVYHTRQTIHHEFGVQHHFHGQHHTYLTQHHLTGFYSWAGRQGGATNWGRRTTGTIHHWHVAIPRLHSRITVRHLATLHLKRLISEHRTAIPLPGTRRFPLAHRRAGRVRIPSVTQRPEGRPAQPGGPAHHEQRPIHRPTVQVRVNLVGTCGQCHLCQGGRTPTLVRNPGLPGFPVLKPTAGQPVPVVRNPLPGFPVLNPGQPNPSVIGKLRPLPFPVLLPPELPPLVQGPVRRPEDRLLGRPVLPLPGLLGQTPQKPLGSIGLMQPENKGPANVPGSLDSGMPDKLSATVLQPPALPPLQGTTVQVLPVAENSADTPAPTPSQPPLDPDHVTQAPALAPLPTPPPLGLTLLPQPAAENENLEPTRKSLPPDLVLLPPALAPLPPLQSGTVE
jgi:hypothetical protein